MHDKHVDSYRNGTCLKRSWSAPSAPLSHVFSGQLLKASSLNSATCFKLSTFHAVKAVNNPRIRVSRLGVLFPAIGGGCSVGEGRQRARVFPLSKANCSTTSPSALVGACQGTPSPSEKESELSYDALKAQLEAATSQIHLLSSANEKTLKCYNALEAESRRLRELNENLSIENELLRRDLSLKEGEIDEQLHLTCELQRELEKVKEIAMRGRGN
ncbi:unnamed protein product [Phytomonas sp. EM1]|nr:unnamed protein product [Phytomonas sp. EM1]|eukprot:CCW63531.1 unnamed protein product [Phytomonas sp. isolate EM1]